MAQAEPSSPELSKAAEMAEETRPLHEEHLERKKIRIFSVLSAIINKPDHILICELLHGTKTNRI